MSEEKPDGYVAWHPKLGFAYGLLQSPDVTNPVAKAREKLIAPVRFDHRWRIRPVKLVFLDTQEAPEK